MNDFLGLITADWLTISLSEGGHLPTGAVEAIGFGRSFDAYASLLIRLELTYTSAAPRSAPKSLIYKAYGSDLYDCGLRELLFYSELAPAMDEPAIPTCYYACATPQDKSCVLLLEDLTQEYVKPAPLRHFGKLSASQAQGPPLTLKQYEAIVDELCRLHVRWWEEPLLWRTDFMTREDTVLAMSQALSAVDIYRNEQRARHVLPQFLARFRAELTSQETTFLQKLMDRWANLFIERVQEGQNITLLHGDFHLLGNIFLPKSQASRPCIIDWGQCKRGIGPHDLAYLLTLSVNEQQRVKRDTHLLKRYHQRLQTAGLIAYSWAQCLWDYRFSILTNVFTSLFQGSLRWFRKSMLVVKAWRCAELLE